MKGKADLDGRTKEDHRWRLRPLRSVVLSDFHRGQVEQGPVPIPPQKLIE